MKSQIQTWTIASGYPNCRKSYSKCQWSHSRDFQAISHSCHPTTNFSCLSLRLRKSAHPYTTIVLLNRKRRLLMTSINTRKKNAKELKNSVRLRSKGNSNRLISIRPLRKRPKLWKIKINRSSMKCLLWISMSKMLRNYWLRSIIRQQSNILQTFRLSWRKISNPCQFSWKLESKITAKELWSPNNSSKLEKPPSWKIN